MIIKLNDSESEIIQKTVDVLRGGGLVVFPSDTVYGLLCDATNQKAVSRIFEFKDRPAGKPISVFVRDFAMMGDVVDISSSITSRLNAILPGPFTVILPSKHKLDVHLESEKGTLGVRMPDYTLIQELVKKFGKPITATSANLSSQSPHYTIESFLKQTSKKRADLIDLIVDAGQLPHNKPSTVVDFTQDSVRVLRQGDIHAHKSEFLISKSETNTKEIAKNIVLKNLNPKKALLIILKGDLGCGKTIFVKGVGEALGVKDQIISPTFVVYYEYVFGKQQRLVHADLYNIQDAEEFKHLALEKYIVPGTIMCIEWGEKAGQIIDKFKNKNLKIIQVEIKHIDEQTRELHISY